MSGNSAGGSYGQQGYGGGYAPSYGGQSYGGYGSGYGGGGYGGSQYGQGYAPSYGGYSMQNSYPQAFGGGMQNNNMALSRSMMPSYSMNPYGQNPYGNMGSSNMGNINPMLLQQMMGLMAPPSLSPSQVAIMNRSQERAQGPSTNVVNPNGSTDPAVQAALAAQNASRGYTPGMSDVTALDPAAQAELNARNARSALRGV